MSACSVCAHNKNTYRPPAGLLHPLPTPGRPWPLISLGFITGLPSSEGNTIILTIVDHFSKAAHLLLALTKLPKASETAQLMVNHVFRLHGIPNDVVSDRGRQFISQVWKSFCQTLGASVNLSSGFNPQSNGQSVRSNQELENAPG